MDKPSLKQNILWLRTLGNLIDERVYTTSVEIISKGDTLTLQLVARHKDGNKMETIDTAQRLRKSLHKWKMKKEEDKDKNV